MCVAVIKPVGAELPTKKELQNCYNNNPHGAGYMYIDGDQLRIKNGFMDFVEFYESFVTENFSKNDLVFIHFRVATHGLVDKGNTHPFPITKSTTLMRTTDCKFDGFGMIHNGVFHYEQSVFKYFDPDGIISDTMLFGKLIDYAYNHDLEDKNDFVASFINEYFICEKEISILLKLLGKNPYLDDNFKDILNYVDDNIGFNKVAIMSPNGNYIKFGDWVENNGCFYSNRDFLDYNYYGFYNRNCSLNCCDYCGKCGNDIEETTIGMLCKTCRGDFSFYQCECCDVYCLDEENEGDNLCQVCRDYEYRCAMCGKKSKYYRIVNDELVCNDCYNKK